MNGQMGYRVVCGGVPCFFEFEAYHFQKTTTQATKNSREELVVLNIDSELNQDSNHYSGGRTNQQEDRKIAMRVTTV